MMKQHPLGYLGMHQDMSKSKTKGGYYFSAENIRVKATDKSSTFGLTNEKGNEIVLAIPNIVIQSIKTRFQYTNVDANPEAEFKILKYKKETSATPGCEIEENYLPGGTGVAESDQQIIIGVVDVRGGAVICTTDGNGFDCFWELQGIGENNHTLTLLYCNNLGLSTQNQVQMIYNYENSIIEKIYFVDGEHQLRFFNMRQSEENGDLKNLVDLEASSINNVSKYDLSQPQIVTTDGGGIHTAGMIQYAYNLYILNGAQTTISPLSEIEPIAKGGGLGGGKLNEEINRSLLVNVNNIDRTYTHIRLYAVKYTSFNQMPSVSLIADREIDNYDSLSYYDDGNIIEALTPEEFLFLGSDPVIPQHIESKDNRLFSLGIKEETFDLDIDARCYGHDINGDAKVWENIKKVDDALVGPELTVNTTTYAVPEKHDAINRDYDTYEYTKNGSATGTYSVNRIFVYSGNTSIGNIDVYVDGTLYEVPISNTGNSSFVADKVFNYLVANCNDHTFELEYLNSQYVIFVTANFFGSTSPTSVADQMGINFSVDNPTLGVGSSIARGAEGLFFRLNITQTAMSNEDASEFRFLKDRELYRYGIIFYNDLGQQSVPKWLCDIKAPKGNLLGEYNQVLFEIKSEFYTWLNAQTFEENKTPVGYKIVRANRTILDRTVLTQGIINPMINNVPGNTSDAEYGTFNTMYSAAGTKMPSVIRTFEDVWPFSQIKQFRPLSFNKLDNVNISGFINGVLTDLRSSKEEFRAAPANNMVSNSFQFNSMMMLYSPELMFENVSIDSSYKLRVIGMVKESDIRNWGKEFKTNTLATVREAKWRGGINNSSNGVTVQEIMGSSSDIYDFGFFAPVNTSAGIQINQMYREFLDGYIDAPAEITYDIYGSPEVAERGVNGKAYNNDERFKYNNNWVEFRVDIFSQDSTNDGASQGIFGEQSNGAKCIVFVEGTDDPDASPNPRKHIRNFWENSGITHTAGMLMAEFIRDEDFKYIGNIYGGNTYESKSVTDYLPIGQYKNISDSSNFIESPGDTYVGDFKFQKMSKTGVDLVGNTYNQTTEIVCFRTETSVDLKNRSDKSVGRWDSSWQADYEEFQDYNRVYSQQANLVTSTDVGFKFKDIQEFDTRVMSSKLKSPGEAIDSWSDPLVNEVLDLDGKYGPITGAVNYRDEIYALQASATAKLSINPRASVTASDGIGLELGTGGVLNDYAYLSTEYGTLNKWSLQSTDGGFYYFDLNKQSILRFDQNGLQNLSNAAGFHSFFQNNVNRSDLILDNPVNLSGVCSGYDAANGDMFMTFLQNEVADSNPLAKGADTNNYFTICWNEETNSFTSFYGYHPSFYLNQGPKFLTTNYNNNELWLQGVKGSNKFYGTRFDSRVNFTVTPEGTLPSIYTNLTYNMEATDQDGNDVPNATFDKVSLRNDYQDSTFRNVIVRKNAKRRDRLWNITLPRDYGTRNRIKSPWCTLELLLNNDESHDIIAHDLIVSYTEY